LEIPATAEEVGENVEFFQALIEPARFVQCHWSGERTATRAARAKNARQLRISFSARRREFT
jgi:hypothetical protein